MICVDFLGTKLKFEPVQSDFEIDDVEGGGVYDRMQRSVKSRIVNRENVKSFDGVGMVFLSVSLRVVGGKGGFGSLLKAQGALMNQKNSSNFESCRDLQGRRLRTINDAKHLSEYLAKEPQRLKTKQDSINKKIEDGLRVVETKRVIVDTVEFERVLEKEVESVKDAVEAVFRKGVAMKGKDARVKAGKEKSKVRSKYQFEEVSSEASDAESQ